MGCSFGIIFHMFGILGFQEDIQCDSILGLLGFYRLDPGVMEIEGLFLDACKVSYFSCCPRKPFSGFHSFSR